MFVNGGERVNDVETLKQESIQEFFCLLRMQFYTWYLGRYFFPILQENVKDFFHQQKIMYAVYIVCVWRQTVLQYVHFVGCIYTYSVCETHTLAQISYSFHILFVLFFIIRASIDVKLCKLLPQFIEKFTSIKGEYFCIFLNNLPTVFFTILKLVVKLYYLSMKCVCL